MTCIGPIGQEDDPQNTKIGVLGHPFGRQNCAKIEKKEQFGVPLTGFAVGPTQMGQLGHLLAPLGTMWAPVGPLVGIF